MSSPGHRHRRVVPENVIADVVLDEEPINHPALHHGKRLFAFEFVRQARDDDADSTLALRDIKSHRAIIEDRLFDKEDAADFRKATQEMLWTLINEIPT